MRKVAARILPIPGVKGSVMLAGFDGASQTLAPNAAAAYVPLQSFEERKKLGVTLAEHHGRSAEAHRGHQRSAADHRPAAAHPGHRLGRRLPDDRRGSRAGTASQRLVRDCRGG